MGVPRYLLGHVYPFKLCWTILKLAKLSIAFLKDFHQLAEYRSWPFLRRPKIEWLRLYCEDTP